MATLTSLESRLNQLETKFGGILRLLEARGIDYPWMPPAEAAPLLGVSPDFIRSEIRRAEANPRSSDYQPGKHFRYKGKAGARRPTKLVNVEEWSRVMAMAPERRR